MNHMTTSDFLRKYEACARGCKFALQYKTMSEVWDALMEEKAGKDSVIWAFWIIDKVVDKKERVKISLFCANRVRHLMTDKRSLNALDVCQRYIDGKANESEMQKAAEASNKATYTAAEAAPEAAADAAYYAAYSAACDAASAAAKAAACAAEAVANAAACAAASAAAIAAAYAASAAAIAARSAAYDAERAAQMEYLRTLPNPFGDVEDRSDGSDRSDRSEKEIEEKKMNTMTKANPKEGPHE